MMREPLSIIYPSTFATLFCFVFGKIRLLSETNSNNLFGLVVNYFVVEANLKLKRRIIISARPNALSTEERDHQLW